MSTVFQHAPDATEHTGTRNPFVALDRCHQQMLHTLERLGDLIRQLEATGVDEQTRSLAGEVVRFFSTEARQHHADEERQVFPALLTSGNSELVQHVKRLQQDHGWLEEDWLELQPPLSAIAEGYSWYDLDMLRHALPVFAGLYQDHIELEESLIYPEAKARLPLNNDSPRGRSQRAARAS